MRGQTTLIWPIRPTTQTVRGRGHFGDSDVADVARLAACGLIQQTADVA